MAALRTFRDDLGNGPAARLSAHWGHDAGGRLVCRWSFDLRTSDDDPLG